MQEMNSLRPARHWSHSLDFRRLLGALRSLVAFALLMAVSRATLAQSPAAEPRPVSTVFGTVRNSDGNPVTDASVFFEEKATSASVETKTKVDGTFSFLALRPGTYTVRAEKTGMRVAAPASLLLSMGEKKQIDLILERAPANPSGDAKEPAAASTMEFDDKPSFTVAGVTDWTNVGGHGSDTKLRTSESLAKETATLKSSDSGRTSADASEAARAADSHRKLGDRAEYSGDLLAAAREYEQAVRLNPSEQIIFPGAPSYSYTEPSKPAAEVFEKGTAAHPKSGRMLAGLGAALYARGDYANAARDLCAAADLRPTDPSPTCFSAKWKRPRRNRCLAQRRS